MATVVCFGAWMATGSGLADGTGFVVSERGHILTSHHVVQGCRALEAVAGGQNQAARLIGNDPDNDLALVQIARPFQGSAAFRSGKSIRPGDGVVVVGFPLPGILSSEASVTTGAVSANAGPNDDPRFLTISAPIQSGNSGGALIDHSGNVVGMIFAKMDALAIARSYGEIPQNINFAIKQDIARRFLDAHRVPYRRQISRRRHEPADIGEQAKRFTVFLRCAAARAPPAMAPAGTSASHKGGSMAIAGQTRIGFPSQGGGHITDAMNPERINGHTAGYAVQQAPIRQVVQNSLRPIPPQSSRIHDASPAVGAARRAVPPADAPEPAGILSAAVDAPIWDVAPQPARFGHSGSRAWAIQVGAFRSFVLADRAVNMATNKVPALLTNSEIVIVPTQTAGGILYRARLGGLDRFRATEACSKLKLNGIGCFVLSADTATD